MVSCGECGHVPECPRCSVSLTYHGANRRLMCHYCNYSEPLPARCPVCGGPVSYTHLHPGDRVVVSGFEHNSVVRPLYLLSLIHIYGGPS